MHLFVFKLRKTTIRQRRCEIWGRAFQRAPETQFQPEQREIGDPLKFAYLFVEKRTGQPVPSVAYVNSKDVQTAKEILAEIKFEEASSFLDFALAAAEQTNFNVQTLGGLRQYLGRYKARQAARTTAKEHKVSGRRDEDERIAYDSYDPCRLVLKCRRQGLSRGGF